MLIYVLSFCSPDQPQYNNSIASSIKTPVGTTGTVVVDPCSVKYQIPVRHEFFRRMNGWTYVTWDLERRFVVPTSSRRTIRIKLHLQFSSQNWHNHRKKVHPSIIVLLLILYTYSKVYQKASIPTDQISEVASNSTHTSNYDSGDSTTCRHHNTASHDVVASIATSQRRCSSRSSIREQQSLDVLRNGTARSDHWIEWGVSEGHASEQSDCGGRCVPWRSREAICVAQCPYCGATNDGSKIGYGIFGYCTYCFAWK